MSNVMSNIVGLVGFVPKRTISSMTKGEVGYTVPWAYDEETKCLDENFILSDKGGTVSLRVECVQPGKYSLTFEEPKYRPIGAKSDFGE